MGIPSASDFKLMEDDWALVDRPGEERYCEPFEQGESEFEVGSDEDRGGRKGMMYAMWYDDTR